MPVIGRLDGQVDEVLIAPLEKRRRGGPPPSDEGDAAENQDDSVGRSSRHQTEQDAAPARPEKETARGELPVWLL